MTTNHTPGPWQVQGKYKTEISGPAGTYIIADLGRPSDPEVCELMQADARLIAAAPEMLEALLAFVASNDPTFCPDIDRSSLRPMTRARKVLADAGISPAVARALLARLEGGK